MRDLEEYLAMAKEFASLASTSPNPILRAHYAALAENYKWLAEKRQRLTRETIIAAA